MTDCKYCHKEIKKGEDFILVGKYPSGWKKWEENVWPSSSSVLRKSSPEDFGTIYHKSCFLEIPRTTPECERFMNIVLKALIPDSIFDEAKDLEIAQTALKRLHKKRCTQALEFIVEECRSRGKMNPNAPTILREAKDYLDNLNK